MTTLKRLREAKQVGTLYHFTTIANLHHIIHQDYPFDVRSKNGETISATRNPHLPMFNKHFKSCDVRIALDGDKISERHKIKPIAGLANDDKYVFNNGNKNRIKRSSGEAEETILHHPLNLKPYIKHIHIIRHSHTEEHVKEHIEPKLKEHGIPYDHNKSYSWDTKMKHDINEDLGVNWSELFEI